MKRAIAWISLSTFTAGAVWAMMDSDEPGSSLEYIVGHLTERFDLSRSGAIEYQQFVLTVSNEDWNELRSLLNSSHETPNEGLCQSVLNWMDALPPSPRESWLSTLDFDSEIWCMRRERSQLDTAIAGLALAAEATGVEVLPQAYTEWTRRNANQKLTVTNARHVAIRSAIGSDFPLLPIDPTLVPWQEALSNSPKPGQTITTQQDEARFRVIYTSASQAGVVLSTTCEFDSQLGWGPTSVVMTKGDQTTEERIFGYSAASDPITRPSVAVRARVVGQDPVRISLIVVNSWSDICDPDRLQLRIPPMHLEYHNDLVDDPILFQVFPSYLEAVPPEERLQVALLEISNAFGTDDGERDFNADGIVNATDIEYVVAELPQ